MDAATPRRRKPYSIGHVTKVTGVNASTLRSWEQQGLLDAEKSAGGHRSYDDADIRRIREVERLRRVHGYSLTGVKRALQEQQATGEAAPDAQDPGAEALQADLIGARVKTLRLEAGLSLRQVAERTGIAASQLSLFERGTAFPSPARLSVLARLFDRTLADLLGGTATQGQPFIRKGKGRIVGSFGPGVSVEQLTVGEQLMDCEIWTIAPGSESDGFYAHDGQELIHVLEGAFELALDGGQPQLLTEGDSAYFESTRQHRWRNPGDRAAVVLWVNTDSQRLASLQPGAFNRSLRLGGPIGTGIGEQALVLALPEGCETFRIVETHTAGHPTRVLIEPLEGLDGATVRDKRDQFRARHDRLRSLLLHEPRGHAASFGLVPVASSVADFGAIFVSSYDYLDMCVHGTIGYARVLQALGRLRDRTDFTLEVPAGIVRVSLGRHGSKDSVTVENVASWLALDRLPLPEIYEGCVVAIAYGGEWYATVDVRSSGLAITPEATARLMELGARIKAAVNARLPELALGVDHVDSTLFYEEGERARSRQFVVIERNKFDRSPCGTGLAARMAQQFAQGTLTVGDAVEVESVLGMPFLGEVASAVTVDGRTAMVPLITGRASLSGLSTLIVEPDDPLPNGFLWR